MGNLTNKQKKEWAAVLYLKENLTQAEIAEKVGVGRTTVVNWVKEGKWEHHKVSITITKEEQLKNLYRQLQELNTAILKKPEGKRYATTAEADTITKLANAIKKMETELSLSEVISAFGGFINWLRTIDPGRVKDIYPFMDTYIKSKYL